MERNKFDQSICNSESLNIFKKSPMKLIRLSGNNIFSCNNPKGIKLVIILRLCLTHLYYQKCRYSFQDSPNPICSCGKDIEISDHFLLHCSNYSYDRSAFLTVIGSINKKDLQVTETLLFGEILPLSSGNVNDYVAHI